MAYKNPEDARQYTVMWRMKNPEKVRAQGRRNMKARRERLGKDAVNSMQRERYAKLRSAAMAILGGLCACCGESEPNFLAIDHVNNDGHMERRNLTGLLVKIIKSADSGRYQILCHNCNWGKRVGICPPHKTGKR